MEVAGRRCDNAADVMAVLFGTDYYYDWPVGRRPVRRGSKRQPDGGQAEAAACTRGASELVPSPTSVRRHTGDCEEAQARGSSQLKEIDGDVRARGSTSPIHVGSSSAAVRTPPSSVGGERRYYSGAKFCQSPAAAELPPPPARWLVDAAVQRRTASVWCGGGADWPQAQACFCS